jgi:hypothetical protein
LNATGHSADQKRALQDAALDKAFYLVELRLADQRAHGGICIEWVADPYGFGGPFGDGHGIVALRPMNEHPRRRLT